MNNESRAEAIVLEYSLYDLPTAQHKAGLIGLLLMIESMKMRRMEHIPEVEYETTWAKITLTPESLQGLFDDLYDASWVEIESRTKWKEKAPKRTIEKEIQANDGKKKTETRFIYDVVQPKGAFLQTLYSGNEIWVKLWRDMLWTTLRGKPRTRDVYQRRADHKASGQAETMKQNIQKAREDLGNGKTRTEGFAGSLYISAQDINAEKVPFQGQVEHNLLLHFWPIASLTYVPRKLKIDGKLEDAGYVFAIPEPRSLELVEDIGALLRMLSPQPAGIRPRDALIDVPQEGGLEYLYHLTHSRIEKTGVDNLLIAIEIYHVDKQGNSIRTLGSERILPYPGLLEDYEPLRDDCRNPLFKSQRIRNLLAGNSWYHGMNALLNRYPYEFFIRTSDTPDLPFFGHDARKTFRALEKESKFEKGGVSMKDETSDDHLALCVHRLIREYVNRRTEKKSGVNWKELKKQQDDNRKKEDLQKYFEAREKVCSDAFLAMRGRKDQAYLEYFTGTICSVPQYLPENDYLVVSQALLSDWEKVKTLAMLALSAVSAVGGSSKQKEMGGEGQ